MLLSYLKTTKKSFFDFFGKKSSNFSLIRNESIKRIKEKLKNGESIFSMRNDEPLLYLTNFIENQFETIFDVVFYYYFYIIFFKYINKKKELNLTTTKIYSFENISNNLIFNSFIRLLVYTLMN